MSATSPDLSEFEIQKCLQKLTSEGGAEVMNYLMLHPQEALAALDRIERRINEIRSEIRQ